MKTRFEENYAAGDWPRRLLERIRDMIGELIEETTYVYVIGPKYEDHEMYEKIGYKIGHKIGISNFLDKRLKTLSREKKIDLSIKHTVAFRNCDMATRVEKAAHAILKDRALGGEYFDVSVAEAVSAIEEAIEKTPGKNLKSNRLVKGQPITFRFNQGVNEVLHKLAFTNFQRTHQYVEQLIYREAEREGFKITFTNDNPTEQDDTE